MLRRLGVMAAAAQRCWPSRRVGGRAEGRTLVERGSTPPATAAAGTYVNPVYDQDFPDPAVLRVGTTYHAYGTQGAGKNIQTLTSPDLVHWRPGADALPELGSWANAGNTWAPEVITIGSTYVMYYVARSADQGVQCIGRATAIGAGRPVHRQGEPAARVPGVAGRLDRRRPDPREGRVALPVLEERRELLRQAGPPVGTAAERRRGRLASASLSR